MGFLRFCRSVLCRLKPVLDWTHTILLVLVIAGGLAPSAFPGFKMTWNLDGWETAGIVLLIILAGRLIWAPYAIYRDQQNEIARLKAKYHDDKSKEEIRERLGELIDVGNHLLNQYATLESQAHSYAFDRWQNGASEYLIAKLGQSYRPRFVTPTPHTYEAPGQPIRPIWYAIRVRLERLNEFVQEVNTLSLKL